MSAVVKVEKFSKISEFDSCPRGGATHSYLKSGNISIPVQVPILKPYLFFLVIKSWVLWSFPRSSPHLMNLKILIFLKNCSDHHPLTIYILTHHKKQAHWLPLGKPHPLIFWNFSELLPSIFNHRQSYRNFTHRNYWTRGAKTIFQNQAMIRDKKNPSLLYLKFRKLWFFNQEIQRKEDWVILVTINIFFKTFNTLFMPFTVVKRWCVYWKLKVESDKINWGGVNEKRGIY